jgi:hypothetical protein
MQAASLLITYHLWFKIPLVKIKTEHGYDAARLQRDELTFVHFYLQNPTRRLANKFTMQFQIDFIAYTYSSDGEENR